MFRPNAFGLVLAIVISLMICPIRSAAAGNLTADFDFIMSIRQPAEPQSKPARNLENNTSELRLVAAGLIDLYRTIISSGDLSVCNFQPSCSHFMTESIEQFGFVKGLLLGADRIQRCHRWAANYGRPEKRIYLPCLDGKMQDPVERYDFKIEK